jgi:C-terminal processing protease CtpA/Prc
MSANLDFVTALGKRIEQTGVIPDVTVVPSVVDAQTGFTRAINEAENLLISSEKLKSWKKTFDYAAFVFVRLSAQENRLALNE